MYTPRDINYLQKWYNAFNVYYRELAPGTVSLTGDRAQGDDSKHCANSIEGICLFEIMFYVPVNNFPVMVIHFPMLSHY